MISRFEVNGYLRARIYQEFDDDPTMGCYVHVVEVVGLPKDCHTTVRVGAPLAAQQQLTHIELTSLVQLLLGSRVDVASQPSDEIEELDERKTLRRWRTFDVSAMGG